MTIETVSADDYNALVAAKKGPKYRNVATEVDGIRFDSRAEARRYGELQLLFAAGEITELQLQPRYPLLVNGVKISHYTADFAYRDRDGALHVEDVKSAPTKTRDYVMRRKLMKALYGVDVEEVT